MNGQNEPGNRVFMFRREQSPTLEKLFAALAETKLDPEWHAVVAKNATAQYGAFANMAALIEATEAALARHSLVVDQTFHYDSDGVPILLVTELGHGGSGQFIRSILPIPKSQKVQETKSAITYMRRTGYEAILGLAPADPRADDDGDAANYAASSNGGGGNGAAKTGLWRRNEMAAKQKILAAGTVDELKTLLGKVESYIADGNLPEESRERLQLEAANRREELGNAKAS
jgi:hypothetical protein